MRKVILTGAAIMMMAGPTYASDLGGNASSSCCADLEERIAELEATTARKGNRKMSLEISGHVNEAVLFSSVSGLPDNEIIDNENSESRFRFKGKAAINEVWSAGFLMELGLGPINSGGSPHIRHSALYLHAKNFGHFWIGHTSTASDSIMEIATSNAAIASTLGSLAPYDSFLKRATGFGLDNPFDGGRKQVIAFRSDSLAGFSVSGSWSDDESWDAAVRYANEFGGVRVAAGIAYREDQITPLIGASGTREFWGGSGSVMHVKSGVYLDGIYGESDGIQSGSFAVPLIGDISFGLGDFRVKIAGGRLGVHQKVSPIGKTNIFVEYQRLQIDGTGIEPTLYGVGLIQSIPAAALDLYVSYRHIDLDLGPGSEADVVVAGGIVRF